MSQDIATVSSATPHASLRCAQVQKQCELALLGSTTSLQISSDRHRSLLEAAVHSEFHKILTKEVLQSIFHVDPATNLPALNDQQDPLLLLLVGIACLHAFIQQNWTGPNLTFDVWTNLSTQVDEADFNQGCIMALSFSGEPIYHLVKHAALLYMARLIFLETPSLEQDGNLNSLPVWQLRTLLVHLRCLEEPVQLEASLLDKVASYRDSLQVTNPDEKDLIASITLLLGHYHRILSSIVPSSERQASLMFLQAANEAGLIYEMTGILGKRTKFQQEEKAQLVVLAQSRPRADFDSTTVITKETPHTNGLDNEPKNFQLNDDTLLEKTVFTASASSSDSVSLASLDPNNQPNLHPFDQALLLALSFNHSNDSPGHGLTSAQIAAFVARSLEKSNNWSVYSMGLLLRSRLEASRTRTVERGVLQMQSLVDQMRLESESDNAKQELGASAQERLQYFHSLASPPKWELERELASRYLNIGLTKSALEIYNRLELWDDVAKCHVSIGQKDRGIEIIKGLLSGVQSESDQIMKERRNAQAKMDPQRIAKLQCTLGEMTRDITLFQLAWEVSGGKSARAMRSLGGAFYSQQNYLACSEALRKAVAINPLKVQTWFILGCSDMKLEEWTGAEQAFTRCIALDDEDAESWTNLASVHLRLRDSADEDEDGKSSRDRKRAAYQCLKQAIKHDRSSWRIWTNYMVVCVSVGELSEACRALRTLVELQADQLGDKAVDLVVLERLVDAVTRDVAAQGAEDSARGLAARVSDIFDHVLLPRFSSNARIFKAHARLMLWKGDFQTCLADHLKAYRITMQDSEIDNDLSKFKSAADELEETMAIWQNLGSDNLPNWKGQCRSMLRTFLGRTKASFEDEAAYQQLVAKLKDV